MRLARRSIFAQIKMSQKVHDLWLKNPQFMNNEQIKKLIQKFIPQFDIKKRFRNFEKWDDIKSRCLVSVDFNKENKTCRWVIAERVNDDLIVYDPKENEPIKNPEKRYKKNIHQYLPISF